MNSDGFLQQMELKDYFNCSDTNKNIFYSDDNIVLFNDLSEYMNKTVKLTSKSIVLLGCKRGSLSFTINRKPYELNHDGFIFIWPGSIIDINTKSPDFASINMCLSITFIINMLRHRNDLWARFFHLKENPTINISEENKPLFYLYEQLLNLRLKHFLRPYHKEIITILIRASLYELLANLPFETATEVEFKRRNEIFRREESGLFI